jgi:hypothetical protein
VAAASRPRIGRSAPHIPRDGLGRSLSSGLMISRMRATFMLYVPDDRAGVAADVHPRDFLTKPQPLAEVECTSTKVSRSQALQHGPAVCRIDVINKAEPLDEVAR